MHSVRSSRSLCLKSIMKQIKIQKFAFKGHLLWIFFLPPKSGNKMRPWPEIFVVIVFASLDRIQQTPDDTKVPFFYFQVRTHNSSSGHLSQRSNLQLSEITARRNGTSIVLNLVGFAGISPSRSKFFPSNEIFLLLLKMNPLQYNDLSILPQCAAGLGYRIAC